MACSSKPSNMQTLEGLLFKATSPTNKIDDVNTTKQFCDAVTAALPEGPAIACRLLAHKIQSPQEREAIQALAVLEACVKSCAEPFHAEVGKFKFLNEMIKLVSPRYLASRTPEHIKKKVIEMLYLWTIELKGETKIKEAYDMLKKQGIVREDPEYVGGAVFAASLPARANAPLSDDQSRLLKKLLQSKNPDDLQQANKIIKGMVKDDERKMDVLTRRTTELVIVNNNSKLLNEMLAHYDRQSCGAEELELYRELFESCEKMQPKLFRLAAETDDNDDSITDILHASDELTRVIDRYRMVIVQGKPDIGRRQRQLDAAATEDAKTSNLSEHLLDLDPLQPEPAAPVSYLSLDEDILGLNLSNGDAPTSGPTLVAASHTTEQTSASEPKGDKAQASSVSLDPVTTLPSSSSNSAATLSQPSPSIDDLLNGSPTLISSTLPSTIPRLNSQDESKQASSVASTTVVVTATETPASSRQRGLDELDRLSETAIKSHLTDRSPYFEKKLESRLPMNKLQQQQQVNQTKQQQDLTHTLRSLSQSPEKTLKKEESSTSSSSSSGLLLADLDLVGPKKEKEEDKKLPVKSVTATAAPAAHEIKLADLDVPLSSIQPGPTPPLTLPDTDTGLSLVLHFGRDSPRPHVTACVVTIMNKSEQAVSDVELKCVVPRGCRVKLQTPSARQLPVHNPFVPPPAITQVMLLANPQDGRKMSLKYVLSFLQDGEPQTEMGAVDELPI